MKNILGNPYLPFNEYVPDGEPRVFDDRLYVYGSHDEANCPGFCVNDYVVWSAPLSDLSDWHYHGISYSKFSDPHNKDGNHVLFAPDVVQGADGNYYLYYCLNFNSAFGVAKSNKPEGPFEFYGHVHYKDGSLLNKYFPYDPAVLVDDDGRVYLYYGFSAHFTGGSFGKIEPSLGCYVVELEQDMLTVVDEPFMCLPSDLNCENTGFPPEHAYFEAPSIRKINNLYYLVYSSQNQHELCYAVSSHPIKGYTYGGVIISSGDVGLDGNEKPVNYVGTNHGGLVQINDQWYIFYHRNTHGLATSRQGCAEKVYINEDTGSIAQVPISSYGLYGKAFNGQGKYSAFYACYLENKNTDVKLRFGLDIKNSEPYYYEEKTENGYAHYIANITSGVLFGYRSFVLLNSGTMGICVKGTFDGKVIVTNDRNANNIIAAKDINCSSDTWEWHYMSYKSENKEQNLYFHFIGNGSMDFLELEFK